MFGAFTTHVLYINNDSFLTNDSFALELQAFNFSEVFTYFQVYLNWPTFSNVIVGMWTERKT